MKGRFSLGFFTAGICYFLLVCFPACALADGVVNNCTEADLRAALAGGGTVTFACDGTITLTNTLTINTNTLLDASGRNVTISGGDAVRVFWVSSGVQLELLHLTVANGFVSNAAGVGIVNFGQVKATACAFRNNRSGFHGGAIANLQNARVTLNQCLFIGNTATSYGGAISGYGPNSITNCTFAYNAAPRGAAIACATDATDYIVNCTFFSNNGNAVENMGATAPVLINSLVAGSSGFNCAGAVLDGGHNLSSDFSCNFTNTGSLINTDPELAPFGDYGGPTETIALIEGSPAIDAGDSATAPTVDQRGQPRPVGAGVDIGAFEGAVPVQGIVQFEVVSYSANEGTAETVLSIVRSGDTTLAGTVDFATIAGRAEANVDYVETNGVVSFGAGETNKTIVIVLFNDAIHEIPENFRVILSNPTGGLWLMGRTNATVTIEDDEVLLVTDCTEAGVRQALAQGGTIRFACDGIIPLASNLVVTTATFLDAAGRDVTLSGNLSTRVLTVQPNVACTVTSLRIINGRHGLEGAGILNDGTLTIRACTFSNNVVSGNGFLRGGALLNNGSIDISDSTFVTNRVGLDQFGVAGYGGAIHNSGIFALRQCTFAQNSAYYGGAIVNWISGTMRAGITNSTFAQNRSQGFGAVYHIRGSSQTQGRLSVVNCTFSDHVGGGGPVSGTAGHATWVANSIIGQTSGSFQDGGNNLAWTTPGEAIDLRLAPLADNGGPTWTMALQPDSPAINQGNSAYCPSTDQRGVSRPFGPACDIGAFEATVPPTPAFLQFSAGAFSVNESNSAVTITVIRVGNSGGQASVDYSTSDGTASAYHDYTSASGTVAFASSQTQATFTVSIKNDLVPEANETVHLTLSNPAGGPALGSPVSATLTIVDNDPVQPGSLALSYEAYSVSEATGAAKVWILRTGGTNGTVTVDFVTSDGTAIAGVDYVSSSGTVTLADGEARKEVVIILIPDGIPEAVKSFNLTLSNPGGGASLGAPSSASISIVDWIFTLVDCSETALRTAVSAGGRVVLACNATIALSSPLVISNGTQIDASGYNATLSGGNATRLFTIHPGVALDLIHLSLADGLALGTNGNTGQPGGAGEGGAIYNNGGTLLGRDCVFLRNKARGGTGGPSSGFSSLSGPGGPARGGAICARRGDATLTHCTFDGNQAHGGNAGTGDGSGGEAAGGAIYGMGAQLELASCDLSHSLSSGGRHAQGNRGLTGSALTSGGAIDFDAGGLKIFGSILANNTARAEYNFGPASFGSGRGGAVLQRGGSLMILDSLLVGNLAEGGYGMGIGSPFGVPGGHAYGGGLYLLAGTTELVSSTLASNRAVGGVQERGERPGSGHGGGVFNAAANLTVVNCTVSGNEARGGGNRLNTPEGSAYGGGFYNSGGSLTLTHATIADNAAHKTPGTNSNPGIQGFENGGGVFSSSNGLVTLFNSIVANAGSNGFGALVDGGHNLSSDASCNFSAPGSLNTTDPKLGPLADYGGPTPTMALLAGSPAIDAASSAFCAATDQRGRARPAGAACDIGAFESGVPYTVLGRLNGYIPPSGTATVGSGGLIAAVDAYGQYALHGLSPGTYTLRPASPLVVFLPKTREVNVVADTLGIDFTSYRSNAVVLTHLSLDTMAGLFAGEAGVSYNVQQSPGLPPSWGPHVSITADAEGLARWAETNSAPRRFFRVERP